MIRSVLTTSLLIFMHTSFAAETLPPARLQKDTNIIGSVEALGLPQPGIVLDARVDTGAELSSLDARNLRSFQKIHHKKKEWVSFDLVDRKTGRCQHMEVPVERYVKIKRHGVDSQCRPVVCMPAIMGSRKQNILFTLADRRQFQYPVLIGRNYLASGQLVDISQAYLAGQPVL